MKKIFLLILLIGSLSGKSQTPGVYCLAPTYLTCTDSTSVMDSILNTWIYNPILQPVNVYLQSLNHSIVHWIKSNVGSHGWLLTGNSGTTTGTNFIGTTDAQDFEGQVNSVQAFYLSNSTAGLVSFGKTAGAGNSGNNITAIGASALSSFNTGANNTAVGNGALLNNGSGVNNTAVGNGALRNNLIGSHNTAIGRYALLNSTQSFNTGIGDNILPTLNTGSDNTAIGYGADVASSAITNATVIGYNAIAPNSNTVTLGNSNDSTLYIYGGIALPNSGGSVYGANGQVLSTQGPNQPAKWITPTNGTVTSVGSGYGLTGGPITSSGTLKADTTAITTQYYNMSHDWLLKGNSGTNPGITTNHNYLGTSDLTPFIFGVNDIFSGGLEPNYGNCYYGYSCGVYSNLISSTKIQNTFTGANAISTHNNPGSDNAGYGYAVLANFNGGNYEAAFGNGAGWNISTGSKDCFFGDSAGYNATTGSNNEAFGWNTQLTGATVSNESVFNNTSNTRNIFNGDLEFGAGNYGTSGYYAVSQGSGVNPVWVKDSVLIAGTNITSIVRNSSGITINASGGGVDSTLVTGYGIKKTLSGTTITVIADTTSGSGSTKIATQSFVLSKGYGTGTVTSIATGNGLTGGTITTTGTLKIDSSVGGTHTSTQYNVLHQLAIFTGTSNITTLASSISLLGSPTTTTQGVGDNSTKIATDAFVNQEGIDQTVLAYQALGSVIKAQSVGIQITELVGTSSLANQGFYMACIYVPYTMTITGIKWYQTAQGAYTATGYNGVALYSYSGGTLTLIDTSTRNGNIWKGTSDTYQSTAFSTTHTLNAGVYYIGLNYNESSQSTAPALACRTASASNSVITLDFTNSAFLFGFKNSVTIPPSSISTSTIAQTTVFVWLGLY